MCALGASIVLWNSGNVLQKIALRESSPLVLLLLRTACAAPFCVALASGHTAALRRWRLGDYARCLGLSALGNALFPLLLLEALHATAATTVALARMTAPIWATVLAVALLGERLSRRQVAGLLLAAIGAAYLASGGRAPDVHDADTAGVLWGVAAAWMWAVYAIASKPVLRRWPPLLVVAVAGAAAPFILAPLVAALGEWPTPRLLAGFSRAYWLVLAYTVLGSAVAGYWCFNWGLRRVPARTAAAFDYLQPPVTLLIAWLVLGERLTALALGAGVVIVLGLYLVTWEGERS